MDSKFTSNLQDLGSRVAGLQACASGAELPAETLAAALDGLVISLQELLVTGEELLQRTKRERRHAQGLADSPETEPDVLRAIMENTHALLAYLDPQFNFVRVNSAYVCGSGHSEEELIGHNHFDLFPNLENQAIFEQVKDTGQPVRFQAKPFEYVDQPDRGTTYWDWSLVPVKDAAGDVQGLVFSLLDVTERTRVEETLQERTYELGERVKELNCLYGMSALVEKPGISLADILQGTVDLIPAAWQCPDITGARITLEGHEFRTTHFRETATWQQTADIIVHGQPSGSVEVCYLEERPESDEGPFLKEERCLINAIAARLGTIIEQVRAEEALQQSEKKYRQLVELAQEGVWVIDAESKTTFVNPRMAEMLGYCVEEMQGRHLYSFMDEHGVEICERNLERRRQGISEQHDFEFVRKDGRRIYTSMETSPITDENGKYVGALALVADITERRRAEALLTQQNQFITTVFESLSHPFYVVDADDYTIKMANSAALGGEASHTVTCYALTHGRTAPCEGAGHLCPVEEIKKTGKSVVVEHVHTNQAGERRIFEVHAHPIFDDAGKVAQIIEYTLDITERKRMEEEVRAARDELELRVQERTAALASANQTLRTEVAERKQAEETLRDSEERYRRLVELAFEGVAIHSQGRIVYVNPQAVKLLGGTSPEDFIGKPIRDFVHPDYWDLAQARVQQVGEEGKGAPLIEETLIRLDGTSVDVEVASVPITYRGQPAVQSVIRDVSQRKRAEVERERERARMARHLHDTLGHSLGYLHLKLDQLTGEDALVTSEGVRQELAQMRDVANDAYELVRGILAASLPSNATDLTTAMLAQARSIGQRGKFEVKLSSQGQPRPLSPVVQQQLLYLVQEALVNVERHADARQVTIKLAWGEDSLSINLSDDGKGFDPEGVRSDRHFGLAIMQERVQEINGQLTLTSCPDMGTEMVLQVPVLAESQLASPFGLSGMATNERTYR